MLWRGREKLSEMSSEHVWPVDQHTSMMSSEHGDQWTSIPACHDGSDDATCGLFRPVTRADLSLVSTPRLPHRHDWQLLPEYHETGHADMRGSDNEGSFCLTITPSLHRYRPRSPLLTMWWPQRSWHSLPVCGHVISHHSLTHGQRLMITFSLYPGYVELNQMLSSIPWCWFPLRWVWQTDNATFITTNKNICQHLVLNFTFSIMFNTFLRPSPCALLAGKTQHSMSIISIFNRNRSSPHVFPFSVSHIWGISAVSPGQAHQIYQ